jgi:hypothetical protein
MDLLKIYLSKYKAAFALIAALVLCVASAAAGATVASWKAKADRVEMVAAHNLESRTLEREKTALNLEIERQNARIQSLGEASQSADHARLVAESFAKDVLKRIKQREGGAEAVQEVTCIAMVNALGAL